MNFMCRRFGTLFHLHRSCEQEENILVHTTYEVGTDSVPKRRHIQFRRRGITQKKQYNIHNKTKALNQELFKSVADFL